MDSMAYRKGMHRMDRQALDKELQTVFAEARRRIVDSASPSRQSMAEMEELIYSQMNQSKAKVLQAWCNQASDDSQRPLCPHCGGTMRNKGHGKRTVICDGGQLQLERTRWWCNACKASFFPSGQHGNGGRVSGDAEDRPSGR